FYFDCTLPGCPQKNCELQGKVRLEPMQVRRRRNGAALGATPDAPRPRPGLRSGPEDDVVRHRLIIGRDCSHELAWLDAKGVGPEQTTVRRDPPQAGFELRNERVELGPDAPGEFTLRQTAFLA